MRHLVFRELGVVGFAILFAGLAGCGQGVNVGSGPGVIYGTYKDNSGNVYSITSDKWNDAGGLYTSATYSKSDPFLVAQSDPGNATNQGLWSRFDWAAVDGTLYVCNSVSAAATQADATAGADADRTDPTTSGCNGSAWVGLAATDPLAIVGSYPNAAFSESIVLTQQQWVSSFKTTFRIIRYDNAVEYFIAQNDHLLNFSHPDLFARFDWVTYQGKLFYCQTAFDQTSISAAQNTPRAVITNPTTDGCDGIVNNFSWNQMN